jgi:hypothetical protein
MSFWPLLVSLFTNPSAALRWRSSSLTPFLENALTSVE